MYFLVCIKNLTIVSDNVYNKVRKRIVRYRTTMILQ